MNVETPARSLLVATCIALACSAMIAGAVHLLRPLQHSDELLERGSIILDVAGRLPGGDASDDDVLSAYFNLDARVVKLGSAELESAGDAHAFNHWQPANGGTEPAGRAPVYFVRSNGVLERVVFPVHGAGMWSTIYGYLALQADFVTIADIKFLSHGETPGVGDRIEEPAWRDAWRGRKLFDAQGAPRLQVVREPNNAYQVDLISGASVTCEAVGEFVRASFADDGYGPLVERLRREGAKP